MIPKDYEAVNQLVLDKFPGLKMASAGPLWHDLAEVGGLGVLAKPTIDEMRGKQVTQQHKNRMELAGLGILAGPSVQNMAHRASSALKIRP